MPALQVRDFPQDLYNRLKDYAEREHRSIAQQVIVAVEKMLSENSRSINSFEPDTFSNLDQFVKEEAEKLKRIEQRKILFDKIKDDDFASKYNLSDPGELIRQSRDERDEEMLSRMVETGLIPEECVRR